MLLNSCARTVIIADASIVLPFLLDETEQGKSIRARLRGESVASPAVVDLEVLSAMRRLVASGEIPAERAARAALELVELPIERAPHAPLLGRCWELRANLTAYDASYVALAEALNATLLTADGRIARAPGVRCAVNVIQDLAR